MTNFSENHKSVLECYSRSIVHIRKQIKNSRFGLIFGSGLSRESKIPTWHKLVESLASDPKIEGKRVLEVAPPRTGSPYQTEMLFEHYKRRRYSEYPEERHNSRSLDYQIAAEWRELIRKYLYENVDDNMVASLDSHPYLKQFLPIINRTHMTITYNFDDFIEQSLQREYGGSENRSRGFESVTNPWMQFRRTNAVIYHPNGIVPQNPLETPSDHFVFSEASFAKQLIGIFSGDQAGLINHLSKHTCLLIGLSLEDDTLRNALMQAAYSCPGNFHYYIHFLDDGKKIDEETRHAITYANFKVYNLITLFLGNEAIQSLGELINIDFYPENDFCDFAKENSIQTQFQFYIIGTLGVGKSTTINQFRNLFVLDEWLEPRLPILAKDWDSLNPSEKTEADNWIVSQFRKKNDILRHECEGIFLLDRGPIDPVTFTPENEWKDKASRLLNTICPDSTDWRVEDGCVIFLQGDANELALRMILTKRETYTDEKLSDLEKRLSKVYGSQGVTSVDTRGLTPADVARRVAEIIHLEPYTPTCNLHDRLERIKSEGFNVKV